MALSPAKLEYHRTWRKNNKDKVDAAAKRYRQSHPENIRIDAAKTRARKKQFILDYKISQGCGVCGETDSIVLEIDHTDPSKKTRNTWTRGTNWLHMSWTQIHRELESCQVLCANCHRRVTHERRLNGNSNSDDD